MFAVQKNILKAMVFGCALLGLATVTVARADATDDINACFNFINAQDYVRAQQAAQALLQRTNLAGTEQREASLCLGQVYYRTGRRKDALPAFQQVEALSQTTEELAVAYSWLGLTYSALDDLDHAELYDQRALKAFRELGDKAREATTLNNLANVVKNRGELERALALYREVLTMQPEAEHATTLNNIALIYNKRKEYKQAIELLRQAIAIDRRNGDAHGTAQKQINLGEILRKGRQYPAAEKELLAGLNAIRLVGDKGWEASACESLGLLEADRKSPDKARLWLKKAEALYREVGNTEDANTIANTIANALGAE